MQSLRSALAVASFCVVSGGCGGGGTGDGILIEGTLTEAGGAGHRIAAVKHSEGQRIENVEICALGQCSVTDDAGQWGFVAPENFQGGMTEFSVNGHGISTTTSVVIPEGAHEVFIDFRHVAGGVVEAHSVTSEIGEEREHA